MKLSLFQKIPINNFFYSLILDICTNNPNFVDATVDSLVLAEHHHDEKKPVILVVGWAGANPKHIDKYIKIYNDEGFVFIQFLLMKIFLCFEKFRIHNSKKYFRYGWARFNIQFQIFIFF